MKRVYHVKKDAHIEILEAQLKEWSVKIDELEPKAGKAEADVKLKYEKEIKKLKMKRKEADSKISEMKEASDDTWKELKKAQIMYGMN